MSIEKFEAAPSAENFNNQENTEKELSPEAQEIYDYVIGKNEVGEEEILAGAEKLNKDEAVGLMSGLKGKIEKIGRRMVLAASVMSVFGGISSAKAGESDDAFAELRNRSAKQEIKTQEESIEDTKAFMKKMEAITGLAFAEQSAAEKSFDAQSKAQDKKIEKEQQLDIKNILENYPAFKGKEVEVVAGSGNDFVAKIDGIVYGGAYSQDENEEIALKRASMSANVKYASLVSGEKVVETDGGQERIVSGKISGVSDRYSFTYDGAVFVLCGAK